MWVRYCKWDFLITVGGILSIICHTAAANASFVCHQSWVNSLDCGNPPKKICFRLHIALSPTPLYCIFEHLKELFSNPNFKLTKVNKKNWITIFPSLSFPWKKSKSKQKIVFQMIGLWLPPPPLNKMSKANKSLQKSKKYLTWVNPPPPLTNVWTWVNWISWCVWIVATIQKKNNWVLLVTFRMSPVTCH